MGLVNTVRGKFTDQTCLGKQCPPQQGCRVGLQNVPPNRLVVDMDKPGSPLGQIQKKCDYLLVAEVDNASDWLAVLELKSGEVKAATVIPQLQAGAKAAKRLIPSDCSVLFRPVLCYSGRSAHKRQRDKLKEKIKFHQQSETTKLLKSGRSLATVFS